jgi:hypothetical protein
MGDLLGGNMQIDGFGILKNEEELVTGFMDCWWAIREVLGKLVLIDNGSSDCTRLIIDKYVKMGLPVEIIVNRNTPHHGEMRTQAVRQCTAPWIFYLDGDETTDNTMLDWLKSEECESADIIDFFKYSTIKDCYHFTEGGNGPSTRMFRNVPGVHFPQNIHTYPEAPAGLDRKYMASPLLFDATGCKSREALWVKGERYQWSQGTIGIGGPREYIWRIETAYEQGNVVEFSDEIKAKIFTGAKGQWA